MMIADHRAIERAVAERFDALLDGWEDYGARTDHRECADAACVVLNGVAAFKMFRFAVFPDGGRWQIRRKSVQ